MNEKPQTRTVDPEVPGPPRPTPMVTPSPTLYGELATSLIVNLDQFSATVPGFDDETVQPDFVRKKLRAVNADFVNSAVGALFGSNELLSVKPINSDEVLDDRQYVDAMLPVAQKLLTVYRRLIFTVQIREARLARSAQQIYGIAKELARDRETSTLRVHVEAMAKARSVRTRKRQKPEEQTAPAPGKEETDTTTSTVKKQ